MIENGFVDEGVVVLMKRLEMIEEKLVFVREVVEMVGEKMG